MRHFLSLVLLLSISGVSCGGSTPSASDLASTTTEAATTTIDSTTTTETMVDADSDEAVVDKYCANISEIDSRFDAADFSDPVALEEALTFQIDTMNSTTIPPAIQDDIATMLSVSDDYYQILETVDFDLFAVEDEIASLFDEPGVEAAGQNLDVFESEHCPLTLDEDIEIDDNPLGLTESDVLDLLQDPVGRAGIAEGILESTSMTLEQANCFLDETDPNVVAALFSIGVGDQTQVDPEVSGGLFEGLVACDMSIDMFG